MKTIPQATGQVDSGRGHSRLSGWLALIAVVTLVFAFIVCVVPLYVRHSIRKKLPTDVLEQLDRVMGRETRIPPELLEPHPYSPEFRQRFASWRSSWDRHGSDMQILDMARREGLADDFPTSAELVLRTGRDILDETTAMVRMRDFERNVFYLPEMSGTENGWGGLALLAENLVDLRISTLSARGEYPRAMEAAVDKFLMQKSRQPLEFTRAIRAVPDALQKIATLTTHVQDLSLLKHTLETMNQTGMPGREFETADPIYAEVTHVLAFRRAAGYPMTLREKAPLAWFLSEIDRTELPFLEWHAARLPFGDPRRAMAEKAMTFSRRHGSRASHLSGVLECIVPETRYLDRCYLYSGSRERVLATKTVYELTLLRLACRIAELETTPSVSAPPNPSPLPAPTPLDPFTSRPYLWHAATRQFYSTGPDKRDNALVDPMDVGLSRGTDIAVPLQPRPNRR